MRTLGPDAQLPAHKEFLKVDGSDGRQPIRS